MTGNKIALVITRMDRGGAPDIVKSLFKYLKTQGCDITLITGTTFAPSGNTEIFLKENSREIIVFPELKRDPDLINDIISFFKLLRLFQREKFDIVHTHTAKAGFIGRIAAGLTGTRIIIHMPHGHNLYGYFNPLGTYLVVLLEKIAALFTDKIIALTNVEKNDMVRYNICKSERIEVIQSGIDLARYNKTELDIKDKRREFNIGADDFLVGMISRLEVVKGPEYFIDATRHIAEKLPQVRFLVVGDGPLKNSLIKRTEKSNISDKIIFTGWREDIPEILSILDILVLPSINEAVGRVVLEAGACSKPVVAADVGGVSEILKDRETGILVPARNSMRIAEAVIDLWGDKKKRADMGFAAKDWVNTRFNENRMVGEIHALYKTLIHK